MATRKTRLITKNSILSGTTLPSGIDALRGEAVVNLNDGILFYSGSTGAANFVPSNNTTPGYFEVGSNINQLKIRDRITSYSGVTTGLAGQFLSGTSTGFVLAPISSIVGVDTFVTGFTYTATTNTLYIRSNIGQYSALTVTIDEMSGLTVNGNLTVTGNSNLNVITGSSLTVTGNTILGSTTASTLSSTTINVTNINVSNNGSVSNILTVNTLNVTGNTTLSSFTGSNATINGTLTVTGQTNLSGTTLYYNVATGSNINEVVNYSSLTSYTNTNEIYVTGATYSPATLNNDDVTWTLLYRGLTPSPAYTFSGENTFTTGGTYDNSSKLITFKRNDGQTGFTVDLQNIDVNDTYVTGGTINTFPTTTSISGSTLLFYSTAGLPSYTLPYTDVFVTGFSYSNNTFTIKDNSGNTYSDTFSTVTGLTVNGNLTVTGNTTLNGTLSVTGLGSNRVVYTTTGGQLTTESGFEYDVPNDTLSVPNAVIGSGGSISGAGTGDLTVHGNLTVFGGSISAFTSELYIEDKNITLNFNPTGSTASSSVNSGFAIQDGNGVSGGTVNFDVIRLQNLTGATPSFQPSIPYGNEYTGLTGNDNRGWITQLNDIVIRSTDVTDTGSSPTVTGYRVLAENDILDGGTY
jgi:hypothetical protein